jgi:hypothetical protein
VSATGVKDWYSANWRGPPGIVWVITNAPLRNSIKKRTIGAGHTGPPDQPVDCTNRDALHGGHPDQICPATAGFVFIGPANAMPLRRQAAKTVPRRAGVGLDRTTATNHR